MHEINPQSGNKNVSTMYLIVKLIYLDKFKRMHRKNDFLFTRVIFKKSVTFFDNKKQAFVSLLVYLFGIRYDFKHFAILAFYRLFQLLAPVFFSTNLCSLDSVK